MIDVGGAPVGATGIVLVGPPVENPLVPSVRESIPPRAELPLPESETSEAHKHATPQGVSTASRPLAGLAYRRRPASYWWMAPRSIARTGIPKAASTLRAYGAGLAATAFCSGTAWVLAPWMALDSLVMVYLVGVVVVAARYGRGPAIVAATASSVAFDFLFTVPFFSLRIADPRLVIRGFGNQRTHLGTASTRSCGRRTCATSCRVVLADARPLTRDRRCAHFSGRASPRRTSSRMRRAFF